MHIVFVLSGFFPKNKAGTESYVLNLAKSLQSKCFSVSVIIPVLDAQADYEFENIPVYTFSEEAKPDKKVYTGLKAPSGLKEFKNVLIKLNPDIVHFHANNRLINSYHIKTAKLLGTKTVFTTHLSGVFCVKGNLRYMEKQDCNGKVNTYKCLSCYLNSKKNLEFKSKIYSLLINIFLITRLQFWLAPQLNIIRHKKKELKKIKKYSDTIISISEWIEETYKLNKIGSTLIKQAVPLNKKIIPNAQKKENGIISILYLGRISYIKGLHVLLDAIVNIQQHFRLIVAGIPIKEEMDYYNKIKNRVKTLQNSIWYENLSQKEVSIILKETDVLCLPSIVKEMAPLSILEAFFYKIPVIGSNSGGIKDLVLDGKNGLLFETGNKNELKDKLELIVNDRKLLFQMSKNIQIDFTYKDLLEQHLMVYTELLYKHD